MKSTIHNSKLLPFSAYFLSNMILQCMTTYFSLRKSQSGYAVSLDQAKHCSKHQKSWVQPKSWEIILSNLLLRIHNHRTYSGQFHFSIHLFPVSVCYFVLTTHSKTCCCCSTTSTRTKIRNSISMKPLGNFWSSNWIWTLGYTPSWWWSCQKVHFNLLWLKNLFLRLKKFDIFLVY